MRVMIVVTHLLGTGHLARALTLARAFVAADHSVRVVSGGMPAPHLQNDCIDQLPPLRSDGTDFTNLLTDQGVTASSSYLAERQAKLLQSFESFAPDVLITELFPFGRRGLKTEFLALLKLAKSRRTLVLSSIRDILAPPSKPAKAQFADETIAAYYHSVLVHSDPDLAPLSLSWPVSADLKPKLMYTGFVAPPPVPAVPRNDSILVSSGGGAVGDHVFKAALDAARSIKNRPWHMLVGGPSERIAELAQQTPPNVTIEGLRPDFRQLLSGAAASVSLAGYNTALDLLQAGTPSVLIPFDDGNEVEQSIRAKALSKLPAIALCPAMQLSGASLAKAVQAVLDQDPRPPRLQNMDGAEKTVQICETQLKARDDA